MYTHSSKFKRHYTIYNENSFSPMVSQPPNYPPQKQYLSSVFFYNFSEIMIIGIYLLVYISQDFPGGSDGKASAYNAGDLGLIPGSGRSCGEGNGNPLQYSCLENSMTEEPNRLQSMGSQRVRHNFVTSLSLSLSYISYK